MPDLAEVVDQRYRKSGNLARFTADAAMKLWRQVDPSDVRASYAATLPDLLATVVAGQVLAAYGSTSYVEATMAAQNAPGGQSPLAVDPVLLAGVASDGRPLETALLAPQIATTEALAAGAGLPMALAAGAFTLVRLVATQIADAGRVGDGVAAVADKRTSGYYRKLTIPSCSRCVVLAGRFYRFNDGFDRHPNCDCKHVPAHEADGSLAFNPHRYFDSLSDAAADKAFGKANAQAIRDGADIGQVVNAGRGMRSASIGGREVAITTEGVTKRGWYAYVQRAIDPDTRFAKTAESRYRRATKPRLMPEQIYALARESGWDRAETIRHLKRNGYFLDGDAQGARPLARIAADVLRLPAAA